MGYTPTGEGLYSEKSLIACLFVVCCLFVCLASKRYCIHSLFLTLHLLQAVSRIEAALSFAKEQINDVDLICLTHDAFGKGDMKKCKISPDAFIQMALQLTYYKVLHSGITDEYTRDY